MEEVNWALKDACDFDRELLEDPERERRRGGREKEQEVLRE